MRIALTFLFISLIAAIPVFAGVSDQPAELCSTQGLTVKQSCLPVFRKMKEGCPELNSEQRKDLISLGTDISNASAAMQKCHRDLAEPLRTCNLARTAGTVRCTQASTKVTEEKTQVQQDKKIVENKKSALQADEMNLVTQENLHAANIGASSTSNGLGFGMALPAIDNSQEREIAAMMLRQQREELEARKTEVAAEERRILDRQTKVETNQEKVVVAKKVIQNTDEIVAKGEATEKEIKKQSEVLKSVSEQIGTEPSDSASASTRPESGKDLGTEFKSETKGQGANPASAEQLTQNQAPPAPEDTSFGKMLPNLFASAAEAVAAVTAPKQDCSNPAFAATSVVCACQSTPNDSRCASALAKNEIPVSAAAAKNKKEASGKVTAANSLGSSGDSSPQEMKEKKISQNGQLQLQNSGGGKFSSNAGSGLQAKENQRGGKVAAGSDYKGGNVGYYSGSGVGSSTGYLNGRIPLNRKFAFQQDPRMQQMPVRKQASIQKGAKIYFPEQQRARSGNGATGPDGITGPHTDLFRKVRIGYGRFGDSLRP